MSKRKKKAGQITVGGHTPRPGQKQPNTIVLTQPKRFGIDISDYTSAVKSAENVDYTRRYKLFDLYSDILMDTHLTCVIEKRKNAVLCSEIEFRKNGKPDDKVNEQIASPWFSSLVADILDAKFWGFTLCQFYKNGEWVNYDLIPRKHADPVRRIILRHQTDITGTSWDEYPDLLFVGSEDELGLLAKAAPWVIYKRNTTADWAQFSEVFGMPIQEYIYDTNDDDARQRAINDAANAGSLAVFVHSKDTELQLREAGNKTGSADVYERLCERCNNEISKLILGNTLTTESSENGTQALGTVHKKIEDQVAKSDRRYVLNVLNYDMTEIFAAMGIDTTGGEFCFPDPKKVDANTKMSILSQLRNTFNLPIDDDYLYEEFGIDKPKNYEQLKKEYQVMAETIASAPVANKQEEDEEEEYNDKQQKQQEKKRTFKDWFMRFFGFAPKDDGAALDW